MPRLPVWSEHAVRDGWRAGYFAFFGVPRGPIGRVGARVLSVLSARLSETAAAALDLQSDDDLLDVGCGSGVFLKAARARHVAGLDASEIQVGMARHRLADRVAAGTAEIVLGDATALPWEDGRFSAVVSVNCLKFIPDPDRALGEMHRVLRPGGRVVLTVGAGMKNRTESGTVNSYGEWVWNEGGVRRMLARAGFVDVSVTQLPAKYYKLQLVRGVRPA